MRVLVALVLTGLSTVASADVTVFMNRGGGTDEGVAIPKFGGTDRTWQAVTSCVKGKFAAFRVDLTDRRPATGTYITALVGGRAGQLGMDDDSTAGVGPYSGEVIADATVHVFSQNIGEGEVAGLCDAAAHEIGHALGLDHSRHCGDLMSYYNEKCGAESFVDVDAPCGEFADRACGDGEDAQNSFRRLADRVGLRGQQPAQVDDEPVAEEPTAEEPEQDLDEAPPPPPPPEHHRRHHRHGHPATGRSSRGTCRGARSS